MLSFVKSCIILNFCWSTQQEKEQHATVPEELVILSSITEIILHLH